MADRPNFLFFITDQHRADYLGCSGHAVLKTPNIDSIAARGTRFERFYVANPVCQPNRSTLITGRMPSLHKVRNNGIGLPLNTNTFIDALRATGYKTALMGKSHLQNMTGLPALLKRPDPPADFAELPDEFRDATKPDGGDYDQEHPDRWKPGKPYDLNLPFYGFEHVDLCTEHSDHVGGHYYVWFKQQRPDADDLRDRDNQIAHDYVCPQAYRTSVPEELYPTAYVREKTIEYLENHAQNAGDAPFFAMASFPDPHHPFTPPGKYWDMYDPNDMELPASWDPGNHETPRHVQWALEARNDGSAVTNSQNAFAVYEQEAKEAMALSCGMITMIDDAVGAILGKLEELGLADNTIVIFTADHGDFMGDHRLMLKGPAHYQGLINVPFIWADPGADARTTTALGSTVDIANTIMERAKVVPYSGTQGETLNPAITGEGDGRDMILVEDDQQRIYLGYDKPPRLRTVVTQDWRMTVVAGDDWGELYDLKNDPHEMENLWDDPAHAGTRAELTDRLARRLIENADTSPMPTHRA